MNSKTKKQKDNLIRYANSNVGFAISIPHTWLEVKKTSYKDLGIDSNTLFAFAADKFTIVTAIFTGFCKKRSFNRFFDKVEISEEFNVLKKGQKEYSNVSSKFIIIEKDEKKIVNNFCLINEMIVNFTINIDPKTKMVNGQSLTMDKNFKLINDILKNIEIFKPINPPVLVNDAEINKLGDEEQNSLAKQTIENDCRYKNILMPDFYLKYSYEKNNSEELLTVINDETYFKGMKDPFRIIKIDENLSSEISDICKENILSLNKMSITEDKDLSNSKLILKAEEQYIYIDLMNEKTDLNLINDLLNNILQVIKKYTNYKVKKICIEGNENINSHKNEEVVSKELSSKNDKKELSDEINQKLAQLDHEIEKIKYEKEQATKVVKEDEIGKEAEDILSELDKEVEKLEELKVKVNKENIELPEDVEDSGEEVLTKLATLITSTHSVRKIKKEKIEQLNHEIEKIKYEKSQAEKVVKEDEIGQEAEAILSELDNEVEKLEELKVKVNKENIELPENVEDSGEELLSKLAALISSTHSVRKTKKEKIAQLNHEIEKIKYEKSQAEKVVREDEIGKEAEAILSELDKEVEKLEELKSKVNKENIELPEDIEDSGEELLTKLTTLIEEKHREIKENKVQDDFEKEEVEEETKEDIEIKEPEKEIDVVIPVATTSSNDEIKELVREALKEEDSPSVNLDINTFDEYYHNIDGHASFRFLLPHNSGEKIERDFNVFDIVKDEVEYRIFIFKCENREKYTLKLDNWMSMNKTSNQCEIKEQYNKILDNGLEIKTFIFENDKFYKSIYKDEFLLAVSGNVSEEKLKVSDISLETAEIGPDNRILVECFDRKMRSIQILKSQNIPYIDELPPIKSSFEVQGKTLEEIAKRAMALCVCCNFASDILGNKRRKHLKDSKKFFNKMIDKYFLRDYLTKDEKRLLDKMDKNLAVQMSWQFEGYAVLLWTLGLIDEIGYPDTLVDPDYVTEIVSSCETYRDFLGKCNLRTVEEVLDLADLTYRYNWYCVDAKIENEEPIINSEIVMERHRALSWLLTNQQWDKVEIDT